MSRTANDKRPEELLDAIVQYLIRHGITDLSLRPLAEAVGSSPRVLLYYFGSKEKMVIKVLAMIRERQRQAIGRTGWNAGLEESCRAIWNRLTAPESLPLFRLYFEVYGLALRDPRRYKDFLKNTIEDWLELISGQLCRDGCEPKQARAFATIILAGLRGLLLDYCASGELKRLDTALNLWLAALNSIPMQRGRS